MSRIIVDDIVKCSPCCHLYFLCYGARVVEAVCLSPGQHSAAWEELWDHHGGGHTGIAHSAPGQPWDTSNILDFLTFKTIPI